MILRKLVGSLSFKSILGFSLASTYNFTIICAYFHLIVLYRIEFLPLH